MQNTTHYNLKKPDYTDFADIQDINDNMDTIDTELAAPTGDGRDQTVSFTDADLDSGITSFPNFLTKIVSGMKLAKFLRDFKAGMAYVLHTGSLINNATCTESGKALDARMGKTLQDQITSLNNSLPIIVYAGSVVNDSITIPSRWAIIYVNVWIANNSSRGITFTILRGFMSTGNGYTYRNGYFESTANCALCEVGVVFNSDGSITLRLNKAFLGGTDYVSTSSLSVSYTLLGT